MLRAVIRTVAEEGRTVLFSSHLLDEVERISDHIAMIDNGEIIYENDMETIQNSFFKVNIYFDREFADSPPLENCRNWEGGQQLWSCTFQGNPEALKKQLTLIGGSLEQISSINLTDTFISLVTNDPKESRQRQ